MPFKNDNISRCPFNARKGYTTDQSRREYLEVWKKTEDELSPSLVADPDKTKPLFFWQLYSLIGEDPIIAIITDFYTCVYADKEEKSFRQAFTRISGKEHHILTQAAYWIDAMGGGRAYHGGSHRLNFHHAHNAGSVMNARGAKRWMHHMRSALANYDFTKLYDPRIKPCIVEFLKTKMIVYAEEFDWEFDENDFKLICEVSTDSLSLQEKEEAETIVEEKKCEE
jgi:truncated hemoglobin YjbI